MEKEPKGIQRQTAVIASIIEIMQGNYIKEAGWNPNYVVTRGGRKISRVNLIGTVVVKCPAERQSSIVVDDGTERIDVRSFEKTQIFDDIDVGDVVLLIGRPRIFEEQKYIVPEIIKKIKNKDWINVRKLQLQNEKKISKEVDHHTEQVEVKEETIGKGVDSENIIELIRKSDKGEGVEIQEIVARCKDDDAEKMIDVLLREGEIFEVSPGKVKIL